MRVELIGDFEHARMIFTYIFDARMSDNIRTHSYWGFTLRSLIPILLQYQPVIDCCGRLIDRTLRIVPVRMKYCFVIDRIYLRVRGELVGHFEPCMTEI